MDVTPETIKQSVEGTAWKPEAVERVHSFQEQEAAFLNVFGDWKTTIGRGPEENKDMVSVRPLASQDISWLSGAIARMVQEKEKSVVNNLTQEDKEQGEEARTATLDTQTAVKGEIQFFNELYDAIWSGIQSKTPTIFVLAPESVAQYINARHAVDTEGTQLDPTLTDTDPSSRGVDFGLVVTASMGEKLKQIFKENDKTVDKMDTCDGFEVRLGGLRLAFFYAGEKPEHDKATSAERPQQKPKESLPN